MGKINTSGLDRHQRAFVALMEKSGYSHSLYTMFRDFCELAALSLSNAVDLAQYEQREARYLQIVKGYKADEVARFPEMLACIVQSLEEGMKDCLGQLFMALDLGNDRAGLFPTPVAPGRGEKVRARGSVLLLSFFNLTLEAIMARIRQSLFSLGQVVATPGALDQTHPVWMANCLARHRRGDWGAVCEEDAATNNEAVREGLRVLSAYPIDAEKPCKGYGDNTLWIITESDRSVTTFLLPEEY